MRLSKTLSIILSVALVFVAGATLSAQTSKKSSTQKKGSVAKKSKKASAKKSTTTARKGASSKKRAAVARRSTQVQPTPDRYREIQQALAERGYFNGEINGKWGEDSNDALRRFQRDQSLKEDGKLGALSIIALGLGPKRAALGVPGERDQP